MPVKPSSKREALSRERILQAALAIVDRAGLDAISMRRLGEELGVEAMSLYHHVPNKAAVLDGIFETVLMELPAPTRSPLWQSALRSRARALRSVLRTHPNALPIFATRPAVTPGSLIHVEFVLEILRNAGLSVDDALSALQVLSAFVIGHALNSYAPAYADVEARPAYDQLDEQRFPRVREAAQKLLTHDVEKEFELGLDVMLAGLEQHLDRRRRAKTR